MKGQRLPAGLTVVNLVLLVILLARVSPTPARGGEIVLRGRALEIVDEQGKVRASIKVQPAGRGPDGKPYLDTSILRLIDPNGRPEVKLAASENGAGLSFVGATDTTQVLLGAQGAEASLKLANGEGRQRVVAP